MISSTGHNPSLSRHRVDVDSTFAQTDDARTYNAFELPKEIDELAIPLIARHHPSGINHSGKTTLISRLMKTSPSHDDADADDDNRCYKYVSYT
jgi:hypothetical protein